MKTRALEVAKYLRTRSLYGEVQLQKLLYYVQGWTLAWTGQPAFVDEIEAWQNGPVVRSMRHIWPDPDAHALSVNLRRIVDAVYDEYGSINGADLIVKTHNEMPWKVAWGGRPDTNRGSDPVEHSEMFRFFSLESVSDHGPKRPALSNEVLETDRDLALSVAAANAQKWQRTLEILGR